MIYNLALTEPSTTKLGTPTSGDSVIPAPQHRHPDTSDRRESGDLTMVARYKIPACAGMTLVG
jgi:hypothetical protein